MFLGDLLVVRRIVENALMWPHSAKIAIAARVKVGRASSNQHS